MINTSLMSIVKTLQVNKRKVLFIVICYVEIYLYTLIIILIKNQFMYIFCYIEMTFQICHCL